MHWFFTIHRESKVINAANSDHEITIGVSWLTIAIVVGIIGLHFFA